MKLILQKDVKNLGKAGDLARVKKGYARNFLIPQKKAIPVNKKNLKVWKHQQTIISSSKKKALGDRKVLIEKLSSIKLKFEKESQKDGRLFGSVTAHEISQALEKEHKLSVDKRDISPSTFKTTGEHKALIQLDSEHKKEIRIHIKGKQVKEEDLDPAPPKEETLNKPPEKEEPTPSSK